MGGGAIDVSICFPTDEKLSRISVIVDILILYVSVKFLNCGGVLTNINKRMKLTSYEKQKVVKKKGYCIWNEGGQLKKFREQIPGTLISLRPPLGNEWESYSNEAHWGHWVQAINVDTGKDQSIQR